MTKNRVVFVLVEGVTEETVFAVLTKLLVNCSVHIHIAMCDLTSDLHTTQGNVLKRIVDSMREFAEPLGLTTKSFREVIHIVDTDGAYLLWITSFENKKKPTDFRLENQSAL